MTGVLKTACHVAAGILVFLLVAAPAKAQFAPMGGTGGEMMTQMAPMMEMMKAKMGKRRFATMMQTMSPMMTGMMQNGGFSGMGFSGMPGGVGLAEDGSPIGFGGGNVTSMLGGVGGTEMIAMIPQFMQMARMGGGHGSRLRRHRQ